MLDRNTPINHTDFENAKKIELRRWNINKFLEVIPCDNQESVSRRWVLSLRYRTRCYMKYTLVARGDEDECLDKSDTESPTCAINILQSALTLPVQKS